MTTIKTASDTFTATGGPTFTRMGYGAMQLAGPGVFGPPKDHDAAIAVLRTAVELGINHVDTADFYGQGRSEELIGEAIAGCRADVIVATKARHQMGEGVYRRGLSRRWLTTAVAPLGGRLFGDQALFL